MLRYGLTECPCPKIKCKNHSKCELCIQHHAEERSKTHCEKELDKNIVVKANGKKGRISIIMFTVSLLAAITGIVLTIILPENPLFALSQKIRIIICTAITLFLGLMFLCKKHKGLLITTSVLFSLLFFTVIGVFSTGYRYYSADLPQYRETINITAVGTPRGDILIVYHPGASSNTKNSVTTFAEALADEGKNVEISTANPDLEPNFSNYDLLVIASNIYNRKVRPPVIDFVENSNLTDVKVFTLFVGNHRDRVQEELDLFMPYLEKANAIHMGHFKYPKINPKLPVDELIQYAKEVSETIN